MKMTSNKIRKWVGNFKFMYTSLLKCLTESWKMGRQLQFYVYFTIKMTNKGDQKWLQDYVNFAIKMANKTVQVLVGNFNCMHLFIIKMANKAVRK